jgi:hypothetical protein
MPQNTARAPGTRVLVVHPDGEAQRLLERSLFALGFVARIAADPAEAGALLNDGGKRFAIALAAPGSAEGLRRLVPDLPCGQIGEGPLPTLEQLEGVIRSLPRRRRV